ncbi:MAG: hypothetical protein OHK0038_21190 [Flammeovirgaceae bacterium]
MQSFDYMYVTIIVTVIVIAARRILKLRNTKLTDIKPDRAMIKELTKIVKKTESFKKTLRDFAPHAPNGEKRRQKLMSFYNETLTKQSYHISTHKKTFELKRLFDKVTSNPRKYFSLIVWGLMFFNFNLLAQSNESLLKEANTSYDNGNYKEAIEIYKTIAKKDASYKPENVNYKIAIAYQKLKKCDSAVVYFKKAYQADKYKGGASSLDKFKEKIASCGLSLADLQSNSYQNIPSYDNEEIKKIIKEGDDLYDKKKYEDALKIYNKAYEKSPEKASASLCYKIAITYQKLKNCTIATNYFRFAYKKDPNKGGASSIEKFKEKIKLCNLSLNNLQESSNKETISDSEKLVKINALKAMGDNLYNMQQYKEGIKYYIMALNIDSTAQSASIAYAIGDSYYLLDNCDSAKLFYALSYYLSPNDGGTISREKFEEHISYCNYEIADLRNLLQQWGKPLPYDNNFDNLSNNYDSEEDNDILSIIIYIFFGLVLGIIIGIIVRTALVMPLYNYFFFNKDSIKLYINTIISDKYYWIGLGERFPKKDVLILQYIFENVSKNVFDKNDKGLLLELKRHVDWLKQKPERYLKSGWIDDVPSENYRWYLMGMLDFDFYCFFTGIRLEEGKSRVIAIIRPDGEVLKVWSIPKIVEYIKNTPKNELVIKIRMHKKDNTFVHWSLDNSFYKPFDVPSANNARMQAWKGESKNIDLQKYYDLYTNFPPTYIMPHPEAVADVYIDYIPFQEIPKTGFEPKNEPVVETSSSLNDVMTGVLIADAISSSSHHRTDLDTPRDVS